MGVGGGVGARPLCSVASVAVLCGWSGASAAERDTAKRGLADALGLPADLLPLPDPAVCEEHATPAHRNNRVPLLRDTIRRAFFGKQDRACMYPTMAESATCKPRSPAHARALAVAGHGHDHDNDGRNHNNDGRNQAAGDKAVAEAQAPTPAPPPVGLLTKMWDAVTGT